MLPIACYSVQAKLRRMIGVDSLERSPQEDTLLVLFNAAISNLVSEILTSSSTLFY
jgi:hypothetical protein